MESEGFSAGKKYLSKRYGFKRLEVTGDVSAYYSAAEDGKDFLFSGAMKPFFIDLKMFLVYKYYNLF